MGVQVNGQPVAAYVLGTIGTVLWCIQLVPQIRHNYRHKSTEGLPTLMMLLWAICAVPFGVYAIAQNLNIPVQVQPQAFGALALMAWAQCLHYSSAWRVWTAALAAVVLAVIFAGCEVVLILTLRPLYENEGKEYPITIIGVIAAVLLAAGLIPPYKEIWKRRGRVVGINFIFLAVDWSGAFFSLMSLVAQNSFDIMGGVMYILCLLLETGIFACHGVWLLRTRKRREAEAKAGEEELEATADLEQQEKAVDMLAATRQDDLQAEKEHGNDFK